MVVVGAVVVVVVVDAEDPEETDRVVEVDLAEVEVVEDRLEVATSELFATTTAADDVPGIWWDITPPKTAALSAAPPVAAPVMRLTFLRAAALLAPGDLADMGSSLFACSTG